MGFNCPAHIFYSYRFSVVKIVTNGLGIIRHLDFYNKDFLAKHPELEPNKKSDSPDEDKSIHDARLLNHYYYLLHHEKEIIFAYGFFQSIGKIYICRARICDTVFFCFCHMHDSTWFYSG